ncbi:TRAP transporter small permease [Mesobacillus foraminis]|uniref:TRAP-type C4-dicarboxylate transport system permease small subunit n=1 Tax=Mesobacillus foraminis TaxID=279826 RepID=A0A4R2AYX5_9BACI|nr:TRAP transporter small permease [Mesobacillus foraminis]TCN18414.1 TRAP-type C4-dicarboxylate transport system permease small subunit [Mesobacillus foraminis]
MDKLLKTLNSLLNGIIVVVLVSMVSLVFLNVVLRYVFSSGITWSEELARYLFVWLVFLGAVVATKEKGHLGVDLLIGAVPKKFQKILYLLASSLTVFVLILFLDGLLKMMELNKMVTGPATGIPESVFYLAGVVSSILMIVITAVQTIRFVFFNQDPPAWAKAKIEGEGGRTE